MELDGYAHNRNLSMLVDSSGAGKTRFYAKPNIIQCNCSYIITDPKAEMPAPLGICSKPSATTCAFYLINLKRPCATIHSDIFQTTKTF